MLLSNGAENCIFERTPRELREFRENKAVKSTLEIIFEQFIR